MSPPTSNAIPASQNHKRIDIPASGWEPVNPPSLCLCS